MKPIASHVLRRIPLAVAGMGATCLVACNALWDIEQLPRGADLQQCTALLSPQGEPDPSAEATAPSALSDEARALSGVFPDFSPECAACLQAECATELTACASDGGCAGFASCRWQDDMSPGGELRCESEYGRSTQQLLSVTRQLNSCWENGCVQACRQGTRWDCVKAYSLPTPEAGGTVTVTQTLQTTSGVAIEGATVRYCGPLSTSANCESTAVDSVVSDCNGMSHADLPVMGGLAGWIGYRQIVHESVYPTRLQTNLIIPRNRNMLQQVVSTPEALALAQVASADRSLGNVLFQVFDCAHMGAEGVVIETAPQVPGRVIRDERTVLGYTTSGTMRFPLAFDATHSAGGGSGALLNLQPNEWLWIRARRVETGELVAELLTQASPGELLLLEIHPDPR